MRPILTAAAAFAMLAASGCTYRSYDRPRQTTYYPAAECDPNYPCRDTYYWDEWRECYVFYDGQRYWDATGSPGTYPPPQRFDVYYAPPPYGYVPPSNFRPPRGTWRTRKDLTNC